jgi:hypothetical protein
MKTRTVERQPQCNNLRERHGKNLLSAALFFFLVAFLSVTHGTLGELTGTTTPVVIKMEASDAEVIDHASEFALFPATECSTNHIWPEIAFGLVVALALSLLIGNMIRVLRAQWYWALVFED